jgi:NAD(P)-dependent dehydrogenase (short-subunit alcohol dehydrogenase family)
MFKYLKEYNMADMRQVIENGKRPPHASEQRLDGKLAVITGATSGVGLSAARRLSSYGADLLMINRNPDKSEALAAELREAGGKVEYITADFSELSQSARAASQLLSRPSLPDILINNAGIHMTRREITREGYEKVFAVNHLSPFIMTRALLPAMISRGSGRIIQVNSQGHRFFGLNLKDLDWKKRPYIGLRAYGAAKTAQLLCTWEFADQISASGTVAQDSFGLTINAMHPGAVKTQVGTNNGRLYNWFQDRFVRSGLDDVEISGIAIHYLAADQAVQETSGEFFNLTHPEKPAPHALDRELGKQIWDVSNEIADRFLKDFI